MPCHAYSFFPFLIDILRLLVGQDITVTSIQDGEGGSPEEFTAGSSEFNLDRKHNRLADLLLPSKVWPMTFSQG